ncbi:rhomboid family intramembrane serine protease [Alkalitalea saponilacus]|uniref:Membrane associated serine protease, rhomboid family n=1 Tax=Alkalitalea saponilacus TaxID=889453 RepID=A0A1T5GT06_9BACT|nr:rhomboid family intramembrane serine protease [Alkalitalea saponilacus]SKC11592.1 Membrane associated serine protease, rhomboid family [Alkalitalea saponilacus]
MLSVHIILIVVICIVSFLAFNRPELMSRFQFNAWSIVHRKQYLRLFSHGFLHGDWIHLFINMFVLWSFGTAVLFYFDHFLPGMTEVRFLILFFSALAFSSFYSLIKHKDNPNYNAVGASGAVSAIVFAAIFFDPYNPVYLFGFIRIPGIIFGVLYLWYSAHMARKQVDNIGHDAHFWGAVYGFIFPLFYEPKLFLHFIEQLTSFR